MLYRDKYYQLVAAGLCHKCRHPRGDNGTKVLCRSCADLTSSRLRKYRAKPGSCKRCGKIADKTQYLCLPCYEYNRLNKKTKYHKYKHDGVCTYCGAAPMAGYNLCEDHWLKRMSTISLGTNIYASQLKVLLMKQNFRCKYSNILLIPGVNASIDHIIARASNNALISSIDNVVWCDRRINEMKDDMSVIDFVNMCRLVAAASGT